MSKQIFFAEFHEKKPFIQRRSHSPAAISWADVDAAMYIGESLDANLRVHKDGFVEEHLYTETCAELGVLKKRIVKTALAELLEQGASIIYNRMEGASLAIREICNQVARFTGAPTVANGYISFGDKETFGNHWDTHDVFAIQLIGRKRWLVYEPTFELPLAGQTSLLHKVDCPAVPVIDEILEAGDSLYIPRGWWHTAVPLREETFHIAVGVHPHSITDYVAWIAKHILPNVLACRQSIRADDTGMDTLASAKDALISAMFSETSFAAYRKHQIDVERCASGFNLSREFRPNVGRDIEQGRYIVNTRFDYSVLQDARTINGVYMPRDPQAAAVLRTIADQTQPVDFPALRNAHDQIERAELRMIIDDLMRRDIVCSVGGARIAHGGIA
ncbi:JmjC domain-containing protein [Undibacterium rugosum]|uniref:JmjC domain-containing protein n=1 Tax=Undibacterium rugosum TaxID=2762291 RepID=UPI001B8151B5|nr:cupin domain-containing protein [Undibacterium rugosum]MBR7780370.1 hypothetical protein [Undibacterium rugosum]